MTIEPDTVDAALIVIITLDDVVGDPVAVLTSEILESVDPVARALADAVNEGLDAVATEDTLADLDTAVEKVANILTDGKDDNLELGEKKDVDVWEGV